MLEKVIFIIGGKILQEHILCGESLLLENLREHGVEIALRDYGETGICHGGGISQSADYKSMDSEEPGEKDKGITATDAANILYITDSEDVFCMLAHQGKYVLPYRHDGNADAFFAGAPYVIEQIEEVDFQTVDMAYRRMAGLPWEILTTQRCVIRETTVQDVDGFYRIYSDSAITEYMEDLYEDRDEETAYIKEYQEKVYGFYGYGMWTVLLKDGTVIGRAGISWREGFDLPELGFVIGVPWQRNGYAYEVCSAILFYGREELGITQVQALVMEENEKSAALCRKLGFEQDGCVVLDDREYIVYKYSAG